MPLDTPDLLKERAHFSRAESRELGKSLRRVIARSELAERRPSSRDAVAHLREQNETRVPDLVPLRMERMLAGPFAFYRGTAGLMALDLGRRPALRASWSRRAATRTSATSASTPRPSAQLVFDLNDFDEAAVAPLGVGREAAHRECRHRRPRGRL